MKVSQLEALNLILKGKVLIVGIGNTLRGDDAAGPALIKSLESKIQGSKLKVQSPGAKVQSQKSKVQSARSKGQSSKLTVEDQKSKAQSSEKNKDSQLSTVNSELRLMDVGEVPENYLEKIIEQRPDTILFVDVADFNAPPGSIKLIDVESLGEGSFSTHNSSLKLVIDYLSRELEARILLLGIQPENLKMGGGLSKPVKEALKNIEKYLTQCMS